MQPNIETKNDDLHVICGGGQIGDRLVDLLAARGHRVRVVQRTARTDARPNVTRIAGDMTDLSFAERACEGARVVYDCMNPQYHQWHELLMPLGRGSLHGAQRAGASLIALDCLYMYGAPNGPMREDSPRTPCSKKGALRVQLEALRTDADRRGDVRVAIARASDYFGPSLPQSLFAPRFWSRLFTGKSIECPGNPDMPHTYSYADDVVRGLQTLGGDTRALGQVWHLPAPPAESTRALIERIGREVDREVRVAPVPQWLWHAAGLFVPFMREAAEMTYQWKVPYVLDDARFRATFGWEATPLELAVRTTVAWARAAGLDPSLARAHSAA